MTPLSFMGLGTPELIAIVVIILVIFGPTQLPKIGRALGGGIKEFKDGLKTGMDDEEENNPPPPPNRPPVITALPADTVPPAAPPPVTPLTDTAREPEADRS